jgi:hypothetical protein
MQDKAITESNMKKRKNSITVKLLTIALGAFVTIQIVKSTTKMIKKKTLLHVLNKYL